MEESAIKIASQETPLGWKVNLMNMLATSLMCLAESIDGDLRQIKLEDGSTLFFNQKKKHQYKMLCDCLKNASNQFRLNLHNAESWYNKLNIDGQVWNVVGGNSDRYDNYTCDAKELLQLIMLYMDRAHSEQGFYSIFRFLRKLPENDIFPEEEIQKFQFKRPLIPCKGATISCQYGKGVIEDQMNGDNWLINMDDGTQRVLTSKQFKIAV